MNATNENFTKYKNSREECALRNWKKKKKEKFRFMKPSYIYIYISHEKDCTPLWKRKVVRRVGWFKAR